jgi:hypothetical protein
MRRAICGTTAFAALVAFIASHAVSQPPGGGTDKRGPPRFELGQVFPPPLLKELQLTPAQQKELEAIRKDLKAKLDALLTVEQKKKVQEFRPGSGRGSPGASEDPAGSSGSSGARSRRPEPQSTPALPEKPRVSAGLVVGGALKVVGAERSPFMVTGDAVEGPLGDQRQEHSGTGIRLLSGEDRNQDGVRAGSLACTVNGLKAENGRWYYVRVRGLAQEHFAVEKDDLFVQVEFFKEDGKNPLDHIKKSIYGQVELERKTLRDAGTNKNLGPATWRNYTIFFRTPFAEVDTLRVTVGFGNGVGTPDRSEFQVAELAVTPIPDPADYSPPARPVSGRAPPALKSLVKLGGRWYYDPVGGSDEPPAWFDHTNVDRLYYLSDRLETPFVGNTSAWLRRGYLDRDGNLVQKDRFVADSLVIAFTGKHLVMKSKNLPNHPTAVFPDRSRFLDGNPNYVQEQRDTWYIPLRPKENPGHVAMTEQNHRALPMGSIGVACNGVVFFNPFDADSVDALWRLDRCCGHPSPTSEYHYHKYPACINTPWADDGTAHSPLIGFAFDGFPVYGPYESAGILAKDSKENPLNEFNLHTDAARGPHYHVTPGKFPHIIGGYWGEVDRSNRPGRRAPPSE